MKRVQEAMDERFPCRPSIKFIKPHRRLNLTFHEGMPEMESMKILYDHIEIPYEIVKHIYELGFNDAKKAVGEEISRG